MSTDTQMFSKDLLAIQTQICHQALSKPLDSPCSSCKFILGTEQTPYHGGQCNVYALTDHSGRHIAMRIFHEADESSAYILSSEMKYRREIERLGLAHFGKVISISETGTQLINKPFVCLNWVHGNSLVWNDFIPKERLERDKIIKTIANISLDLLDVQEKCISARDETIAKIQRKVIRARDGKYSGGGLQSCIKQMDLLEKYWVPDLDAAPRVLVYSDLSPNNIIVDEEFDVKSIIDLGWAEMIPLQFAATYPRFLTHEPRSGGTETHKTFDWAATDTDCMQEDRLVFRNCIRDRALIEGGLCQVYHDLLGRDDEVDRYWWFKAISEVDKHRAMETCDWSPKLSSSES